MEIIKQKEVDCKTINDCPRLKVLNDKAEFFGDERQFYTSKNKIANLSSKIRTVSTKKIVEKYLENDFSILHL